MTAPDAPDHGIAISDLPSSAMFQLHHVGLAVPDIAAAASRYVQAFGYRLVTDVIHDSAQGAFVQFLCLPSDLTYLELVQPDGPDSALAAAVSRGGGINHLCYATDDIESACRALWQSGMCLIASPVPAVAFKGRRIAWLMGRDRVIIELVERSCDQGL